MTHALTHMNNPKITRATLPALLPTILAGLFILAACGGSVLPTDVTIAPTGTNTANNLDTNTPDSIFLGVGEQPPEVAAKSAPPANTPANTPSVNPIVKKQVQVKKQDPAPIVPTPDSPKQVKKQEQIPAPVFEVAVAPARPPQRSFSTAPQVSTDFVPRSDATGESGATGESSHAGHNDGAIKFDDWVASFTAPPPTNATTKAMDFVQKNIDTYTGGNKIQYNDEGKILAKDDTVLTYTAQVQKADGTNHAEGDAIMITRDDNDKLTLSESELDYIARYAKSLDTRVRVPIGLSRTTRTVGTKSQFLEGLTNRLDERPDGGRQGWVTERGSLNLAIATYGGVALGGDFADGVAFFRGFGGGFFNYAGLYSGTDLGAPLVVEADKTAEWKGHILVRGSSVLALDQDFLLTVDFSTARKLTASTRIGNTNALYFTLGKATFAGNGDTLRIDETTTYDANGVITGHIFIQNGNERVNGIVTGLIGEQGAVGAVLSGEGTKNSITGRLNTGASSYYGGFVARPTPLPPTVVDASDLTGYATIPTTIAGLPSTPSNRGFLKIEDGASLVTTGVTDPVAFTASRNALTASSNESIGDGYTFINETGYVAMLPTTDLGAARPVGDGQPTAASWSGAYSLTSSSGLRALLAPITFTINFNAGSLTGRADRPLATGETISILANFGANGVMSGSFGTTSGSIQTTNTSVIGLIGEEGLVGIMHGVNGDVALAGGFTASPPE